MRWVRLPCSVLLVGVALAGAVRSPRMAPAIDAGTSASATTTPTAAAPVESAAEEAALTVYTDVEQLQLGVSPADGAPPSTSRVTITVASPQPYVLRASATGDLVNVTANLPGVGIALPPSVLRVSSGDSGEWHSVSTNPVALGEYLPSDGGSPRTHTVLVQAFDDGKPGWDVSAGSYEVGLTFEVLPVPTP